LAKKDQQKNLNKYMTRIEAAEQYRDNSYKELWARCYKRYRNHVDELVDPKTKKIVTDRSNISIPYCFLQVETILPRIIEVLFANRPYITVMDREPSDLPGAKRMETLLDWQMNERFDIQDLFHHGIKECCIYGTAIGYTGWKWEQREVIKKQQVPVTEPDPLTGAEMPMLDDMEQPITEWQPVKTNEIDYDDPEAKFIDLGLFYADPSAEDIDDARYCGHDEFKTKDELQQMVDLGLYKIDWKKVPKDRPRNEAKDYRMSSVGLPTNNDQVEDNDDDALYRVTHYWEDNKHVVILNRAYIAADGENPFWHRRKPYRKGVYTLVPHEFYGMGIIEMMEDLQDELNTERNMRIDFRAFLLRRMFKIRRGANIKKEQLKWRQGGYIEVDDMDDVMEFGVSDVAGSSFAQESTIKQDMQDCSGAQDVVMGTAGNRETATTTMTKDANASMRFKLLISSLEKKLLVGLTRLIMQNNQQFIDAPKWIRVTGEDGGNQPTQIAPEEIQGEFDLFPAGSSVEPLANKEAAKQRMTELYNVAGKDPIYEMFPEKRLRFLKKLYEAHGMKDSEQLLPTDEEFTQMQQRMAQLSAAPPAPPGGDSGPITSQGGQANTALMQEAGLHAPTPTISGGGGYI
jgi:hypothetical protein